MSSALKIKTIKVQAGQTIVDIAVQEYGTVEGIVLVLQANPWLSITTTLVAGQELLIWGETTINLVKEITKTEPYFSQLQNLLVQWAKLVPGININSVTDKIEIPKLHLEFGSDFNAVTQLRNNDQVLAWWETENKKFLDYNPQIWSFGYKSSHRSIPGNDNEPPYIIHRAWRHEPHLNGINFPVGSNYYRGSINSQCADIKNTGRKTEFLHTATKSNEKMIVGIDPWDYYYNKPIGNPIERITSYEEQDAEGTRMMLSNGGGLSKTFRLAIVIDNPEFIPGSGKNPKRVGALSDNFQMSVHNTWGITRVKFKRESNGIKIFGSGRFE